MPSYKLTYFDGRGRGELIRLCLAYAGQEFEDCRIEQAAWPELKKGMMPPYMPALLVDGNVSLHETCLVAQYVAQKYGFGGDSDEDKMIISSYTFFIESLFTKAITAFFEKDEEKKKQMQTEFGEKTMPDALAKFEECAAKNAAGVLHGSGITQADIHFYNTCWTLMQQAPTLLDGTPKLKALFEKVSTEPKIAQWVANRPSTKF